MNCDRQYSLSQFAGLTARAGSVCLQCGDDPYHALELLETVEKISEMLHFSREDCVPGSLQTHVDKFIAAIADSKYVSRYNKARLEVNGVLEWLWDSIVKPVLAAMNLVQKPSTDDDFPRVCWVGSGLLNILPIHAAGYQDLPQLENALDCVISSYSPTLKALSYAEEHALQGCCRERSCRVDANNSERIASSKCNKGGGRVAMPPFNSLNIDDGETKSELERNPQRIAKVHNCSLCLSRRIYERPVSKSSTAPRLGN